MNDVDELCETLSLANRILAREDVVDGFGHVSARHPEHPDRFLLSRSLSPALVTPKDIMVFDGRGQPIGDDRAPYLERFIHAGIYAARPDVHAVVHHHAREVIPFSITSTALRPVIHMAGALGEEIPVWDIRRSFGDTNLLVTNMAQAEDLATTLGARVVALMRGHGAVVTGASVQDAVLTAIYSKVNASILLQASALGPVEALTPGEAKLAVDALLGPNPRARAWEYFAMRATGRA
jgi:ribulose-5-phosphate 4-epimerase/fuculose-1-phosphate aldolase